MSTDIFRRYLDLLNEADGQPPADFTPTHFHKNNLGSKIPLMQTPDGKFWWETTATGDDGGPVQKGGARKSIQPWTGDTENRSSGLSGKSSVDGVFKNGEAIEFPEGMTWKDYADQGAKSIQTALGSKKVKEIPHIDPGELVAPNKKEAPLDPPGYRFSNDQALANLAAQMKDAKGATTSLAAPTGSKTDSPESLEILKQIKELAAKIAALPPISIASDEYKRSQHGEADDAKYGAILDSRTALFTQMTDLASKAADIRGRGDMSDVTAQQISEISMTAVNKMKEEAKYLRASADSTGGQTTSSTQGGDAPSGSATSVAAGSLPAGIQWAFAQNDKFRPSSEADSIASWKANNPRKSAADWRSIPPADGKGDEVWDPKQRKMVPKSELSTAKGKETVITDSSRCAQCGTPKSIHAPLKHEFVSGDDIRPGPVGGSRSSSDTSVKPSSDTSAADQARIDKMPAWDRAKNAPVGATSLLPPKPLPPKPRIPGPALKENINRLPVVDQMRSWKQLMEAPADLTAAQSQAQRAGLGRPGSIGVKDKPDTRNLTDKLKAQDKLRDFDNIDRQVPKPKVPASTAGFLQPVSPNSPLGRAQATATPPAPPKPPANWKNIVSTGFKRLIAPALAAKDIYDGWQEIQALPRDKMSKAEFNAAATKIATRLVTEYGIIAVSTYFGGLAGGLYAGVGAIPGAIAGGAAGWAAESYFGNNISSIINNTVDYFYGTDKTPAPQEVKPTPEVVSENKTYLDGMAAWIAAGGIPDEQDKKEMAAARAILKSAGVAVAPAPTPAPAAAEKVPAADPVAKYKETFDKANAIVDKIKNLDPLTNPALPPSAGAAALAKAQYNLISELTSLYAAEIDAEDQKNPAVKAKMDAIVAAAHAAADAKDAEHAGKEKTTTGGPKEGEKGTSKNGRPIIFTNGRWEYAN